MADKGAAMYQGQVQLASMTGSLFGHTGIIMRMSAEPFATLTGKVARIAELDEIMQEIELLMQGQAAAGSTGSTGPAGSAGEAAPLVGFDGCDIVTPRGECVAQGLTLTCDLRLMFTVLRLFSDWFGSDRGLF